MEPAIGPRVGADPVGSNQPCELKEIIVRIYRGYIGSTQLGSYLLDSLDLEEYEKTLPPVSLQRALQLPTW